ncbi:hypothetical protein HY745_02090, partial [Candidatus Desantisbacteria bacterium]|nr:hypothetical protein [Candidatus Desantisbacteria bacterium]
MKNKILYNISLLCLVLILVSFIRFYLLQKQGILEDSLIQQSEIRGYIDTMILSMNTSQFVVYVRQTDNKIDNDKIIDAINTFEDTLLKLINKYKFEIDRNDCMTCHVSINEKMTRVDNSLNTIISLLNEYKINVSLMFTTRDKESKEKVIKKIGEAGSGIVSEINRINHISSKMMNAIDEKIKKDYFLNKKIVLVTLTAGIIITLFILIYLLIYLNKDINRFKQQIDIVINNNYEKKLESAKFDVELLPIVNASNKLIEEINYRE